MASASITITITDAPGHTLVQVRDRLLTKWNYTGNGTNQQKLDFIQAHIAEYIKDQYKEQIMNESNAVNAAVQIDVL